MMLIIGIDPGITGAICFFEDRKIIDHKINELTKYFSLIFEDDVLLLTY